LTLFIVGLLVLQLPFSNGNPIQIIGDSFFEIGALFFISKFFFLAEDTEWQIERLEKELDEARKSPGMGLALSYYYNFIVPTAANLSGPEEDGGQTAIDMEVKRGEFQPFTLTRSQLLVFIPRDLDGSDMKAFLRTITNDKKVIQGKPKEKAGKQTHRPLFVYFLEWDEAAKTCNALFDLPTVISSCYDRARDQLEFEVDIGQEILDFQNRLIDLVKSNPLTNGKVCLVSLPKTPFQFDYIKQAAAKILEQPVMALEVTVGKEPEKKKFPCLP